MNTTLVPASIGAGGAVALDWVIGSFGGLIPAGLQTPQAAPFVRIGAALLLGAAAASVTNSEKIGGEVAAGAVIVTVYQLFSQYMNGAGSYTMMGRVLRRRVAMGNGMGDMGNGMGRIIPRRGRARPLNAYLGGMGARSFWGRGRMDRVGMGWIGPGRTLSRYTTRSA